MQIGRPALGAFAFFYPQLVWMVAPPSSRKMTDIVWQAIAPFEVPVLARRDGFLIFDFEKSPTLRGGHVPKYFETPDIKVPQKIRDAQKARENLAYRRFVFMNAILQSASSSIVTIQQAYLGILPPISPWNHLKAEKNGKNWWVQTSEIPLASYPKRHVVISRESLNGMLALLKKSHEALGNSSIDILSLIYMACHQYSQHQFQSAHLIAWTVIEKLINRMWAELQDEIDIKNGGFTKMSAARKTTLDGRDYTASVIIQFLSFNKKINDEVLSSLTEARVKRNKFAHNLEQIDSHDAGKAIVLATRMLTHIIGHPVTYNLQTSSRIK